MHNLDPSIKLPNLDDLIASFAQNNTVLFAGAGISISAGLPSWQKFMNDLLDDLEASYPNKSFKKARDLTKKGDYILAAELIKEETGPSLSKSIDNKFSPEPEKKTGPAHKELARISFSFAITTNYDSLLEQAYGAGIKSFTWQNISDFFKYIKKDEFAILKLHGDSIIDNTHIMARNDYVGLMGNFLVNSVLSSFLSHRTFLFLGYSLQDPNIIKLLEEGKSIFGNYFGPHYIFLYEDEVDPPYLKFLEKNYNLIAIISEQKKTNIEDEKENDKTKPLISFLRYIGGKSASIYYNRTETTLINSNKFDFFNIIKNRLKELVKVTGSDRIYLALTGLTEKRTTPSLEYIYSFDKSSYIFSKDKYSIGSEIEKDFDYFSLIRLLFYRFGPDPDFLYIPDSGSSENWDGSESLISTIYKESYSTRKPKKSILMVQIFLDGACIGVLWVESDIIDAYTIDHLRVLQSGAHIIASIFRKLELRLIEIKRINFEKDTDYFIDLMNKNLDIQALDLCYLLYKIDYENGKLIAYHHSDYFKNRKNSSEFYYTFNEKSFAGYILNNNKQYLLKRIPDKLENKNNHDIIFSEKGIEEFEIPRNGSLFGTPIRVGKYTSFVMVVWRLYKKENPITLNSYEIEAIDRTASLIANSSYRGGENDGNPFDVSDWIDKVNTGIHELLGPDGRIKIYTKEDRKTVIHSCLAILASKSIGLQRIRLYVYLKRKGKFVCISSLSTSNATLEGQTEQDFYGSYTDNNLKIGRRQITADENNEYCQFTINRFLENPYAMHQHKDMFKEEDINTGPLDKDEHGRWIVCPIAKRRDNNGKKTGNLVGFISADNHAKVVGSNDNKLTEMKSNELTDYFQRYALDVISNILYPAVFLITRYDSSDLSKKVKKAEAARRSKRRGKGATG